MTSHDIEGHVPRLLRFARNDRGGKMSGLGQSASSCVSSAMTGTGEGVCT